MSEGDARGGCCPDGVVSHLARWILGGMMAVSLFVTAVGLGLGALVSGLAVRELAAASFVSANVNVWLPARGLLVAVALGVSGALLCVWRATRMPLVARRSING